MRPPVPAIGIVGSGVVARALGRALHDRGARVAAVWARHGGRGTAAAAFIGPQVRAVSASELVRIATHLVVAVSDTAVPAVAEALGEAGFQSGVALHTCGARGPEALAPLGKRGVACGVLHPLQTLPAAEEGVGVLRGITFGIGGDAAAVVWAEQLAALLGGRPLRIAREEFASYHAAAALAANGIPALLDAALALMQRAGVGEPQALDALGPLCRASVENVLAAGPQAALTGPVARGDAGTIAAHLGALRDVPDAAGDLYRAATRSLVAMARRRGLSADAAALIDQLLGGGEGGRT